MHYTRSQQYQEKLTNTTIKTCEEIIDWMNSHYGKMPRPAIYKERKRVKRDEMTEEEKKEVNLYSRWMYNSEMQIIHKYLQIPIEKVPEQYRNIIHAIKNTVINRILWKEIEEWLKSHNGKMPRAVIQKNNKKLKASEMTEEEKKEVNLRQRWEKSSEKEIFERYRECPEEQIPIEYREIIKTLKNNIRKSVIWTEIEKWLKSHNGKMPSTVIRKNKKTLKASEMTEEEKRGINLRQRWDESKERKIFERYRECSEEQIPVKYREIIKNLKLLGLGKTAYDEVIEWLKTHNGRMPRGIIYKDGRNILIAEMTEEERFEVRLKRRWNRSIEAYILRKYENKPIENMPKEYREKIAKLRELMQARKRKDKKIENRMRQAVGKQVKNNMTTREELSEEDILLKDTHQVEENR